MSAEIAKPYLDPRVDELLAAAPPPRRALFLDRDGVINIDHGYVHKPEDTEWMPGIFELCAKAQRAGYLLVVVTNQAGIARGYYSVEQFFAYTRWVHEQFAMRDVPLTATYYCPHHREGSVYEFALSCDCRKPKPGMILTAAQNLTIDVGASVLLGDSLTDIQAGDAASVFKSLIVNSGAFKIDRLFVGHDL